MEKMNVWVQEALVGENVKIISIDSKTTSELGDGFNSNNISVNVIATNKNGNKVSYNLLLKYFNDENDIITYKSNHVRQMFERELRLYNEIFPFFRNFEAKKGLQDSLNFIPKCYKTIHDNHSIVIVMEDLTTMGYVLHNKKSPLNVNHLNLTLEQYGKLHALSFAIKDQMKEEFLDLSKDMPGNLGEAMESVFVQMFNNTCEILRENKEYDVLEKFQKELKGGWSSYQEIADVQEPQSCILHGDCWVGNFMFKYENDLDESPKNVKFLDWQISKFGSPVMDLSYHLYVNCSSTELQQMQNLLKIYYTSFASHLRALGSDPEKLFSWSDFKNHWKKYSKFALTFLNLIFNAAFGEKDEFVNTDDKLAVEFVASLKIKNQSLFISRILDVVKHHVNFEL